MAECVSLPYGEGSIEVNIPRECRVTVLDRPVPPASGDASGGNNDAEKVKWALSHPIGKGLAEAVAGKIGRCAGDPGVGAGGVAGAVKAGKAIKVAIAISDPTRGVPNSAILGPLLEGLEESGIHREGITLLVGCGKHREPYPEEIHRLVDPDLVRGIRIVAHQAGVGETVHLGTTSRGTPVRFSKPYVEADIRIITGMIEPHQLAGYSGGAKSVFIGLGDEDTISHNHSLLLDPMARAGVFEGNPVREDMEEGFGLVGADFMVNVVLDTQKRILRAFAGSYPEAYLEGVRFARDTSCVYFAEPHDIVLVSCGGHPKDINMYQAQKALVSAETLVKPGGVMILLARCPDGAGEERFVEWMRAADSPERVIERFRQEGFKLGAHKAFLLARSLVKAKAFLVSDLPDGLARELFFEPYKDAQVALGEALRLIRAQGVNEPSVAVVPQGIGILPVRQ